MARDALVRLGVVRMGTCGCVGGVSRGSGMVVKSRASRRVWISLRTASRRGVSFQVWSGGV